LRLGLRCRVGIGSSSRSGLRMCCPMRMFWRRTSRSRRLVLLASVRCPHVFFGCCRVRVILTLSPDGLLSENTGKACEGEEAPSRIHDDQRDVVTIRERFEEGKATELYRTTIMISTRLVVSPKQHSRFGAHGSGTAWVLATRTERSQQSGTYSFQLV
jgi:hypothetical protein